LALSFRTISLDHYLRHLAFQLLIPLSKLADLTKIVLDTAIQVFLLRLLRAELVL